MLGVIENFPIKIKEEEKCSSFQSCNVPCSTNKTFMVLATYKTTIFPFDDDDEYQK